MKWGIKTIRIQKIIRDASSLLNPRSLIQDNECNSLPQFKRTPCGFCFIEYYTREDCEAAMAYINGTRLDDRIIRTDYDAGFTEGRQYGRARAGDRFETRC